MSRTVIAAVDGSAESLAAADWAAHEARMRRLPLHLLHVWQDRTLACPTRPGEGDALPGSDLQRDRSRRIL
ncbi:universal stress protein, partial [Streptomyces sp. NPDC001193]